MKDGSRELGALRKLREISSLLAFEVDPRRLVPLILDQAIALVGAERGFVLLVAGNGPQARFDVAAARNLDREEIQQPEFKVSRSIVQRVARTGTAELISDAEEEIGTRDIESVKALHLRSIVCVPLKAHGRMPGVLYVDHRHVKGEFDREDLATLEAFAVPAAIALAAAQSTEELRRGQEELARRIATTDRLRVELAERYRERSREANSLRDEVARHAEPAQADGAAPVVPGFVARSHAMKRVLELVRKVAPSEASVLILGESGTGKELIARALHSLSGRREGPFLAENCSALADPLLESELFGHEEGAFTGAVKNRPGLFESARTGTIFLDEVGDMSPGLQAKLLRVIQEREVRRIGAQHAHAIDVRVLAATHRDLEGMVANGTFRADLFYRLNVVRIELPPLRERPEDIPALIDHFLAKHATRRIELDPQARELLLAHPWPGNVRELENEIKRLAIFAEGEGVVRPGLLSPTVLGRHGPPPRGSSEGPTAEPPLDGLWRLDDLEKEMILRTLRATGGNKTLAARLLGLPKTSFFHRLEKHGLKLPRGE